MGEGEGGKIWENGIETCKIYGIWRSKEIKDAVKTVFAYFTCCVSLLINSGAKTTEKIIIDGNNFHKGYQHDNIN